MGFQRLGTVERGWLEQLTAEQNEYLGCRWIETDPRAEDPYCGSTTQPGSSYCPEHHARAYSNKPPRPISLPKGL